MKIIKIIINTFLTCALLAVIAWGVLAAVLQTDKGQQWMLGHVITYVEQKTGTQISIKNIELLLPFQLRIHELAVKENDQQLFSIHQLDLSCTSPRLLEGTIVFNTLQAKGVTLDRLPATKESDSQGSFNIENTLPFYIKIHQFSLEQLTIHPHLLQQWIDQPFVTDLIGSSQTHIQGHFINDPYKNRLEADILLSIENMVKPNPPILIALTIYEKQLSIALHCNHFPLQSLVESFNEYYSDIDCHAMAPIARWNQLLNQTSTHDPIEGFIKTRISTPKEQPSAYAFFSPETILESHFLLLSKDQLYLLSTELSNACMQLRGEGLVHFNTGIEGFNFTGEIKDWDALCSSFSIQTSIHGATFIEGTLAGSFDHPSIRFQFESPLLNVHTHTFNNVSTLAEIQIDKGSYQGNVHLDLNHEQIPYQFSSSFIWNHPYIALSDINFQTIDSHIQGHLKCSIEDFISEGELYAHLNHLDHFSSFVSVPLQGEADIAVQLMAKGDSNEKKQDLTFNATGRNIRWDTWTIDRLQASIHTVDSWMNLSHSSKAFSQLKIQGLRGTDIALKELAIKSSQDIELPSFHLSNFLGDIDVQALQWQDNEIKQVQATISLKDVQQLSDGTIKLIVKQMKNPQLSLDEFLVETKIDHQMSIWPFKMKGKGFFKEKTTFNLAGSWHFQSHIFNIQLDAGTGSIGAHAFKLLEPSKIVYEQEAKQKLQIHPFHLLFGGGEFLANIDLDQEQILCQCKGIQIPTDLLHFLYPDIPVKGRASFDLALKGPVQSPSGQLSLSLHRMQIAEKIFASRPFIEGNIQADLEDHGINIQGVLHGIGKNPLVAKGVLPIDVSLSPFSISLHDRTPFHLNLQAEGELDPYLHLFYNDSTNLSGHAKISLILNGYMLSPQIQGEIDISNGAYESLSTGAIYKNIHARIEGTGSKLVLKHFSAEDNKQGVITALGSIQLDAANHFPFEFHIQPRKIFILDSDYVTVSASGSLVLTGNQQQGRLRGTLEVDQGTIRMEQALPTQVKSVDVKYINTPEGDGKATAQNHENSSWPLLFEIKAIIPDHFTINDNRLTSEWKGEILVTGTPSAPLLNGEMRIVKGVYDFNGKRFNLTQGSIYFAGSVAKKTSIYIVASREINRIIAEIIVKGPVSKLAVSFRSNPPLAQREVLSYILFDRGISDITPDQGSLLSQSFFDLHAGESTQTDFLTRLRNNIGIDRLDFTSSDGENQDLALQVGKYISDGVFISINKSINTAANRVAIEAKLRKNLQAQAEVGDDAQGKVLLKWKKDY